MSQAAHMATIALTKEVSHAFNSIRNDPDHRRCSPLLVNNFIPMASPIKSILNAVVVIGVVLWLLDVFGFMHTISDLRVGR
jgi:hypothetical protein